MIWFDFEGVRVRDESVELTRVLMGRSMTLQQIAATKGTTKGAIHCTIMRLLDRGLWIRTRGDGAGPCCHGRRRSALFTVTTKGKELVAAFDAHMIRLREANTVDPVATTKAQPNSVFDLGRVINRGPNESLVTPDDAG